MSPGTAVPAPRCGRCRRPLVVGLVLLLPLIGYWQRTTILTGLANWLDVGQKLDRPVDGVLVLGGGVLTRPFVAVEMLRSGFTRQVLIPRVQLSAQSQDGILPSEQEIMRDIVLRSGGDEQSLVLLEGTVDSTEHEAAVAAAYLKNHPDMRLAVVTNHYHTRRARWLFRQACGPDAARVVLVSAPVDEYDATTWWHTEAGLVAYTSEYLKFARVVLRSLW